MKGCVISLARFQARRNNNRAFEMPVIAESPRPEPRASNYLTRYLLGLGLGTQDVLASVFDSTDCHVRKLPSARPAR